MKIGARLALFILGACLAVSCADEAPTSPSASRQISPPAAIPSNAVLSVVSGETGSPVPNARIIVSGNELRADADGRLVVAEPVERGTYLDVLADGFLDRQTLARDGQDTRLTLWPNSSPTGLDAAFTFELVYTWARTGEPRRLLRLPAGADVAYVVAKEPIRSDPVAMETVTRATEAFAKATDGATTFIVTDTPPPGAIVFELVVDPGDPALVDAVAVAKREVHSWEIVGGTVVYAVLGTARTSTSLHELGHMFGLGHSSSTQEVMYGGRTSARLDTFSAREALAMRLMLQRSPGNDRPDNDRDSLGSTLRADDHWISTVTCTR